MNDFQSDFNKLANAITEGFEERKKAMKEWNEKTPPNVLLNCNDLGVIGLWKMPDKSIWMRYASSPGKFRELGGTVLEPSVVQAIVQLSQEEF